jgi:hypothetical protein
MIKQPIEKLRFIRADVAIAKSIPDGEGMP